MQVELSKIHLDIKDRLRAKHKNIPALMTSIARRGQIQPIVLRPPREGETIYPSSTEFEKEWIVEVGARRFLAFVLLQSLFGQEDIELHSSLEPGLIEATIRKTDSELMALEVEFHENEDRDGFDWKDKASYIWRIHDGHASQNEEWTPEDTAILLEMGESTVYNYLEFRKHTVAFQDKKVQEADSYRVAKKQFDIAKKLRERERVVEFRKKNQEEESKGGALNSLLLNQELLASRNLTKEELSKRVNQPQAIAGTLCTEGDCREWIKEIKDSSLDFLHWDPPYGGSQSGGAFTSYSEIDDSWKYAQTLIRDMLPEIYRTLKDGHWLVIWCHPSFTQDIARLVAGHKLAEDLPLRCVYCEKAWNSESLLNYCPGGVWSFWVNPYPNHWYKVNRASDGHEIKRFLINAEEPFLFAAKIGSDPDPILPRTDRQNVFTFSMPSREERRHIMHKPKDLLREIISCVSLPGEVGADPSYGSGTIIEAALESKRKILGCEINHDSVLLAREAVEKVIEEEGIQL